MKAMTKQEFIAYWLEPDEDGRSLLDYNEENLFERESQYLSECAMFGDAGPGQGLVVREMKAEIASVRRRLASFKVQA